MRKDVVSLPLSSPSAVAGRDTDVSAIYPGEIYLHPVKLEILLISTFLFVFPCWYRVQSKVREGLERKCFLHKK